MRLEEWQKGNRSAKVGRDETARRKRVLAVVLRRCCAERWHNGRQRARDGSGRMAVAFDTDKVWIEAEANEVSRGERNARIVDTDIVDKRSRCRAEVTQDESEGLCELQA